MKQIVLFVSTMLLAAAALQPALAQNLSTTASTTAPTSTTAAQTSTTAGEVQHLQQLNQTFPQASTTSQTPPQILPQYEFDTDDHGTVETYQPGGATTTPSSAFFKDLGTNGRTCFTCHQQESSWGLSVDNAAARFAADPTDPLFRVIDGATCPSDDVSTPAAMQQAYSLLTGKGLIRIGLPLPAQSQFQVSVDQDAFGNCNINPETGLTGPTSGFLSFYRRPLPSTNLGFISGIMWDTREPSLFHQAIDATLGHAQAIKTPTGAQQNKIVAFEGCNFAADPNDCTVIDPGDGVFTAQSADNNAGDLTDNGATGGPFYLYQNMASFVLGINDPFNGQPFNPAVFSTYDTWANLTGTDPQTLAMLSLYRGEQVFNTVKFQITGVAGLNDVQGKDPITGTCSTCHNNPNVGNHSSNMTVDIGVTDASPPNVPPNANPLDITGLPVFSVQCSAGPLDGRTFIVTDLGVAMVSGQCADIGKTKIPIIRGIAGRSPYFHNGSAPEITNLIDFYNDRFNIGLTDQQKSDLGAFLESL